MADLSSSFDYKDAALRNMEFDANVGNYHLEN